MTVMQPCKNCGVLVEVLVDGWCRACREIGDRYTESIDIRQLVREGEAMDPQPDVPDQSGNPYAPSAINPLPVRLALTGLSKKSIVRRLSWMWASLPALMMWWTFSVTGVFAAILDFEPRNRAPGRLPLLFDLVMVLSALVASGFLVRELILLVRLRAELGSRRAVEAG